MKYFTNGASSSIGPTGLFGSIVGPGGPGRPRFPFIPGAPDLPLIPYYIYFNFNGIKIRVIFSIIIL